MADDNTGAVAFSLLTAAHAAQSISPAVVDPILPALKQMVADLQPAEVAGASARALQSAEETGGRTFTGDRAIIQQLCGPRFCDGAGAQDPFLSGVRVALLAVIN